MTGKLTTAEPREFSGDLDWGRLARLDGLRPVVDPNDCDGIKNKLIDGIQWRALKRTLPKTGRILDLGCGIGRFATRITRLGLEYVGIDSAHPMLIAAKRAHSTGGAGFAQALAARLPFADGGFDVCLACGVFQYLSHTPLAEPTLREIRRVLAPRGRLLLLEQASMSGRKSGSVSNTSSENDYIQQVGAFFETEDVTTVRLPGLTLRSASALSPARKAPGALAGLSPVAVWLEAVSTRVAAVRRLRREPYYDFLLSARRRDGDKDAAGANHTELESIQ